MGLLEFAKKVSGKLGRKNPNLEVIAKMVPVWDVKREMKEPVSFVKLAKESYCRNVVVNSCINELAKSAAEPRLVAEFKQGEEWVPVPTGHQLATIAEQPNEEQSMFEFLEQALITYFIGGNVFWHKARPGSSGPPVEIWNLRPDRVQIIPGEDGFVEKYKYTIGSTEKEVEPQDVVHMKRFNPTDDHWGLSPLKVAGIELDTDNAAMEFLESFFANSAVPFGMIKVKARMTPAQRKALQASWEESFGFNKRTGAVNWNRVGVADADFDFEPIGGMPATLGLDGIFMQTESRLCSVCGVPPILVAIMAGLTHSTYANYESAMKDFWQRTLIPGYARIAAKLTQGVALEFGEQYRLRFDLSEVRWIKQSETDARLQAVEAWQLDLISRDEARESMGMEAVDGKPIYHYELQVVKEGMGGEPGQEKGEPKGEVKGKKPGALKEGEKPVPDEEPPKEMPPGKEEPDDQKKKPNPFQKRVAAEEHYGPQESFAGKLKGTKKPSQAGKAVASAAKMEPADSAALPMRRALSGIADAAGTTALGQEQLLAGTKDILARKKFLDQRLGDFVEHAVNGWADELGTLLAETGDAAEMVLAVDEFFEERLRTAYRVAALEAPGAHNFGRFQAFVEADVDRHEWVTAGDKAVRSSHAAQDGVVRATGERWPNGLAYPGDFSEGAKEAANCRCITIPAKDEHAGRAHRTMVEQQFLVQIKKDETAIANAFRAVVHEQRTRALRAVRDLEVAA